MAATAAAPALPAHSSVTLKAPPSRAGAGSVVGEKPAAKDLAVDEKSARAKLDSFDAKHAGAPSPDFSGLLDDDGMEIDQTIDPVTGQPVATPVPARTLQPQIRV